MLEILSYCLSKNLNRVFGLKIQNEPQKILEFLLHEVQSTFPGRYKNPIDLINEQEYIEWYENIFQLKFLEAYLKDGACEIILHSPQDIQVFALAGHQCQHQHSLSTLDFNMSVEILSILMERKFSYENPFASFHCQLHQMNCRVSLVHESTSTRATHSIYCRIANNKTFSIENFLLNPKIEKFTDQICANKYNVVISGATSSGKTSLAKSFLTNFSQEEHIVILEDTKELDVKKRNYSHLLTRDGQNEDLTNFCSNILRMRPDRILLGEIRSSEVVPLLLNLNCGHKGLLTTIHANSAPETLDRIATLFMIYGKSLNIDYQQVLSLVCNNIDFVIHMEKAKIKEIIQVHNSSGERINYEKLY